MGKHPSSDRAECASRSLPRYNRNFGARFWRAKQRTVTMATARRDKRPKAPAGTHAVVLSSVALAAYLRALWSGSEALRKHLQDTNPVLARHVGKRYTHGALTRVLRILGLSVPKWTIRRAVSLERRSVSGLTYHRLRGAATLLFPPGGASDGSLDELNTLFDTAVRAPNRIQWIPWRFDDLMAVRPPTQSEIARLYSYRQKGRYEAFSITPNKMTVEGVSKVPRSERLVRGEMTLDKPGAVRVPPDILNGMETFEFEIKHLRLAPGTFAVHQTVNNPDGSVKEVHLLLVKPAPRRGSRDD